jgi:hypothetical protein
MDEIHQIIMQKLDTLDKRIFDLSTQVASLKEKTSAWAVLVAALPGLAALGGLLFTSRWR